MCYAEVLQRRPSAEVFFYSGPLSGGCLAPQLFALIITIYLLDPTGLHASYQSLPQQPPSTPPLREIPQNQHQSAV